MNIKYYGHSCFEVEVNGTHLLFDPFITPNEKAKHIDLNAIKADYILVSHGHADHVADVELLAKKTGATVIGSWEVIDWFTKKGLTKTHPVNIGGKLKFDFGFIKFVTAVHSSSMPDGTYGGTAMGFVIESNKGNFYYAGDTALTMDMKLIGDFHKIDFAFLPIGDNFTMGSTDALSCSDFIKCKDIIGMHYDTFGYIVVDKEKCMNKFKTAGKKLMLMEIGESITKNI